MADEKILLECRNLKKYFDVPRGCLHAVDDISFTLPEGHTLGVVGESGCGKSTLGRTILRLTEATSGEIVFEGRNILELSAGQMRRLRQKMQMIFQDPYSSLHPKLTVSQAIEEPLKIHGMKRNERTDRLYELMELVGLDRRYVNTYPHELDGGRRQRIGIARALALNPRFIVCDEPVSALDVSIQAQILNLLMDLKDQLGLTYIFVTHDMSVVKHISDRVMVMYLGQMVELADADELFISPMHPYTQALLSAIPVPDISYKGKDLGTLAGEVTSPVNPPAGCRFAARCPHATERCHRENPKAKTFENGHTVACHLYD